MHVGIGKHIKTTFTVVKVWINLLMFSIRCVLGCGCGLTSLVPRPPFNTARGKGDLVNIVQHFYRSAEFRRYNLIGLCGNISPVLGFLTANHLALLITPLQTSFAHPPLY